MEWICANEVTPISDTYFNVSGLHEGIDYAFRVAAENRAGLGSYSEVSSPVKCYVHKGQSSVSVIPRVLRITSLSTSQTIVRQLGHAFCIRDTKVPCGWDSRTQARQVETGFFLEPVTSAGPGANEWRGRTCEHDTQDAPLHWARTGGDSAGD